MHAGGGNQDRCWGGGVVELFDGGFEGFGEGRSDGGVDDYAFCGHADLAALNG